MSDTRHSLAGYQGEGALIRIDGEELAQIVEIGKRCEIEGISLEEVIKGVLAIGMVFAEGNPGTLKELLEMKEE